MRKFNHHIESLATQAEEKFNEFGQIWDGKKWQHIRRNTRGSLNIFDDHDLVSKFGHDFETIASTPIDIKLKPNHRHIPVRLIEAPTKVVIENVRLNNARKNIIALGHFQGIVLPGLSQRTGIEEKKLINFFRGKYTPTMDFMQTIAECYHCQIDDLMEPTEELVKKYPQLTSRFNSQVGQQLTPQVSSKELAKLKSKRASDLFTKNLNNFLQERGLQVDYVERKIGKSISSVHAQINVTTAQDIANALGYPLETFTTCEPHLLPPPNQSLIKNLMKRTSKILVMGAAGLLAAVPGMALDLAVESASHKLEENGQDLMDPSLPKDHPENLIVQLRIASIKILLDFKMLYGKTIDGVIEGIWPERDMQLGEQLIAHTLLLPINILSGAAKGYLEAAEPIVEHTKEWIESFKTLAQSSSHSLCLAYELKKQLYKKGDDS